MASPLAHTLVSLAIARRLEPPGMERRGLWYGLMMVAACAPDLDFVLGAAVGDINRYHHGPSHSLGMAVAIGAAMSLAVRGVRVRGWGILGLTMAYASHIALDAFSGEPRLVNVMDCSQPLFWPVSDWRLPLVWPVFKGIHHGLAGDDLRAFVRCLFTQHNADALLIEWALLAPLPMAAFAAAGRARVAEVIGARPSDATAPGQLVKTR